MLRFIHIMENKKRILFVIPKLETGGVSSSLLGLLKLIPYEEYDVTLMLFSRDSDLLHLLPTEVKVNYVDAMAKRERLRDWTSKILQACHIPLVFSFFKRIYHKFGVYFALRVHTRENYAYDTAIAYQDGLVTWYVAQNICALKKIAFVHTDFAMAQYNIAHERQIYVGFDQICFGSKAAQTSFLSHMPQFAERACIVPNVTNIKEIREKARNGIGFTDGFDGLRIVTLGRLSHEKGCYKIPELVKKLKEDGFYFRWYLIGDGPLRAKLKQFNRSELVLLGTRENPYPFLQQCDLYVQPSDYEGFCISLAEARALACPIVTCDFSGAREQIADGETGIITGYHSMEIYEGIKRILDNKDLRAHFKEQLTQSMQHDNSLIQQWLLEL